MKFIDSDYRKILLPEIDGVIDPVGEIGPHSAGALAFIEAIPEASAGIRYAPGKWSIAELIGHLIDTQIIWTYRILWIARGEQRPLAYADENLWTSNSRYDAVPLREIRGTYGTVCASTQAILAMIPKDAHPYLGSVNGVEITVLQAMATLIAHERHHLRMIKEKYLAGRGGI